MASWTLFSGPFDLIMIALALTPAASPHDGRDVGAAAVACGGIAHWQRYDHTQCESFQA
jgi:hypothetical protein